MQEINKSLELEDYKDKKIMVITGAGISVDSGIRPYWGEDGSYAALQDKYGADIGDVLSIENFKRDPVQVWDCMKTLFDGVADPKPNVAHHALVEIERVSQAFTLVTQNCDTLHTQAGSQNVLEIHGNASVAVCVECGERDPDYQKQLIKKSVPLCPSCTSILRPDVVLFGEYPRLDFPQLVEVACQADILLVVGTQAYFGYITELFNAFAATGGRRVWVDVEMPNALLENWQVLPSFTSSLEFWVDGATEFFKPVMAGK
ncbi:Sir2 family NAD-dependent protein deacetylase [Vibrio barjaei]|uniref:Sir2 family NAD-dependent protein deacetylase n=1 Tax=Vibrio barjaei TaxID=1676683 RepID=UPI002284A4D0|nr:Sir2 family NAD-dependent protein deacetylase [Vibrio barjaei]MCY9873013.1 hypothetical protein [Vibrio barjaei]